MLPLLDGLLTPDSVLDGDEQLGQVLDLGPSRFMLGSALRLGGNLILELRERCGTVGGGVLGRQLRPPTNVSRILVALAAKPTRARRTFTGLRRPGTSKSGGVSCPNIPATRWTAGRCRPIDFLQDFPLPRRQHGHFPSRGDPRGQSDHVQLSVGGRLHRRRE